MCRFARRLVPLLLLLCACRHAPATEARAPSPGAPLALQLPADGPAKGTVLRAFVLGDGGEPGPVREAVDAALRALLGRSQVAAAILMPGDLFYPRGLPDRCGAARERVKQEYVDRFPGVPFVSVAGNHDHGDLDGEARPATVHREAYFDCAAHNAVKAELGWAGPTGCDCVEGWSFPTGGALAGSMALGPVTVVAYDSQQALANPAPVARALATELAAAPPEQRILLLAHHPFDSYGPHGGTPVRSAQEVRSAEYGAYLTEVLPVVERSRDRIALAVFGHDHLLEYFPDRRPPMLVSGSASKTAKASGVPADVFAVGDSPGLSEIDLHADGSMEVTLVTRQPPRTFPIAAR